MEVEGLNGLGKVFIDRAWLQLVWSAMISASAVDEQLIEAQDAYGEGRYREAYDLSVWVLEHDVENSGALVLVIHCLLQMGEVRQARPVADRLSRLYPDWWLSGVVQGWVLASERKPKLAAASAIESLHHAPDSAAAYAGVSVLALTLPFQAGLALSLIHI